MAKNVKLSPEIVLKLGQNVYKPLIDIMTNNKNSFSAIETLATGNNGDSYWDGTRAFSWFCAATRTCCNNYYRVYKVSEFFEKMCDGAADLDFADNDGKYGTGKSLIKLSQQFSSLKDSASKNYSTVLSWAQTK